MIELLRNRKSQIVVLIILFGFLLRLHNYASVPPYEAEDEIMYPLAFITFIQTGTPSSWSAFPSYSTAKEFSYRNLSFRVVTPWIEKPPLHSIITGTISYLFGARDLFSIDLKIVRLVPLILSLATMLFTYLIAKQYFSQPIALIALSLYATTPMFVAANRLSYSENLLTPIILSAIWVTNKQISQKIAILGILSYLAILTRQTAFALTATLILLLVERKKLRSATIICFFSYIGLLTFIGIGAFYDFDLFWAVFQDYQNIYTNGLPNLMSNLFRYITITHQFNPFRDPSMLTGYILLFSAPLFLKGKERNILLLPYIYFIFLSLLNNGAIINGWHFFVFYPFISILIAKVFYLVWQTQDYFLISALFIALGLSSTRFILTIFPTINFGWQWVYSSITFLLILTLISKQKYKKLLLQIYYVVFLSANIIITINFHRLYPDWF